MDWLNVYGLFIMAIIMLPNIIFAIKINHFENRYQNKGIETIEQIGRFGSMAFMIFNVPLFEYGYWFDYANICLIAFNGVLVLLYYFVWILHFRHATINTAMALAIIPTIIFLSSGFIRMQALLIIMAILFGIGHITITYHNNKNSRC